MSNLKKAEDSIGGSYNQGDLSGTFKQVKFLNKSPEWIDKHCFQPESLPAVHEEAQAVELMAQLALSPKEVQLVFGSQKESVIAKAQNCHIGTVRRQREKACCRLRAYYAADRVLQGLTSDRFALFMPDIGLSLGRADLWIVWVKVFPMVFEMMPTLERLAALIEPFLKKHSGLPLALWAECDETVELRWCWVTADSREALAYALLFHSAAQNLSTFEMIVPAEVSPKEFTLPPNVI